MTSKNVSNPKLTRKERKFVESEVFLINKLQQIDMADDLILESLKRIEKMVKEKLYG